MSHPFKGLPLNIQLFTEPGEESTVEIDIDELFNDLDAPPASNPDDKSGPKNPELTKAMSKRINEVKAQTEREAQDKVAKELGYENYAAMKKANEAALIKKQGYNPDDLEKVIEPLLQKRLADDPRLKEFEALKKREQDLYIQSQLTAINEATGQQLKITDLSKETVALWQKGIDLEKAYWATEGKTIAAKMSGKNGTLTHLATGASQGATKTRPLTEAEKDMYRQIAPHLSEEQLSKKTVAITEK